MSAFSRLGSIPIITQATSSMFAELLNEAWCKRHLGQILPVTHEKDWDMVMLLDDRARQVERDTGRVFCRHPREDLKAYGYAISRNRRRMNRR
jgi:hypothetical protein